PEGFAHDPRHRPARGDVAALPDADAPRVRAAVGHRENLDATRWYRGEQRAVDARLRVAHVETRGLDTAAARGQHSQEESDEKNRTLPAHRPGRRAETHPLATRR